MTGENPNDTAAGLLKAANSKLEVLTTENADLKAENELLTEVNKDLTLKIEELSSPKSIKEAVEKKSEAVVIPSSAFEVGGVQYKFISPVFMNKQRRVKASDALLDQALLNELVSKGSSLIVKA